MMDIFVLNWSSALNSYLMGAKLSWSRTLIDTIHIHQHLVCLQGTVRVFDLMVDGGNVMCEIAAHKTPLVSAGIYSAM